MTLMFQKLPRGSKLLLAALFPAMLMAALRGALSTTSGWAAFWETWTLSVGVLLFAYIGKPGKGENSRLRLHGTTVGLLLVTIGSGIFYTWHGWISIGWLLLTSIFALLLGWGTALGPEHPWWLRIPLEGAFALAAGSLPALLVQIETRFSTEEFFVVLEIAILSIFWLALRVMFALLSTQVDENAAKELQGFSISRGKILIAFGLAAFIGIGISIRAYQHSFYPPEAPPFPGISDQTPFLCGEIQPSQEVYPAEDVFQAYLEQVVKNPRNNAPEYGLLALGSKEPQWAAKFRESLLAEAQAGWFTEPSGSIKYGQYLASQRAYFYPRIRDAFPGLFSPEDERVIADWFAAINQRAFNVEPVDWMYALAFRYWPQGPYENQENGAGLLALLETQALSDPAFSDPNRQYLDNNLRGWLTNFRVTDDAAMYQPEWMENAWFQSFYTGEINLQNRNLAFTWLKVLALPDGSPLRYNHVGFADYAAIASWGGNLLNDKNLVWLAGRAMEDLAAHPRFVKGQPGAEQAAAVSGISPSIGNCLVYGNSGLPTQQGPLAPDKIVLRNGWERDSIYLLLNLRFSGWHRYKASNAIVQIYQREPLVIEDYTGKIFPWLPEGRSLFRDKRIPRENLNGLQIQKTGLDWVLYRLTALGSPWAQDPPYYAKVTLFETTPERTVSVTQIENWHGWQHQRTIYFYSEGVIAVLDKARGPKGHPAALTWHFAGDMIPKGNRIPLGVQPIPGSSPEVVLLSIDGSQPQIQLESPTEELTPLLVKYNAPDGGHLKTATIFLFNEWVGAKIKIQDKDLIIVQDKSQFSIPLDMKW